MVSLYAEFWDVHPAAWVSFAPTALFNNCINCFEFIAPIDIMERAAEAAAPFFNLRSARPIDCQEVADNRLLRADMVGQHLALKVGVCV